MGHVLFSSEFSRTLPQVPHNLPGPQTDLSTYNSFSSPVPHEAHMPRNSYWNMISPTISSPLQILVLGGSGAAPRLKYTSHTLSAPSHHSGLSSNDKFSKRSPLNTVANVALLCPPANPCSIPLYSIRIQNVPSCK